ncbi:hypothetical protein CYMTET_41417 [Cymbomonas tetramitiformis]|uniref:Uncharacterized protein n=1 Tax=Cymbomonas tetramitiformis TaxID=36881 RepID=A0AAE0C7K4_9CHLO|nr:hypothetical protein CYMTET_41417 [Cymbomonas tetramitiformis]
MSIERRHLQQVLNRHDELINKRREGVSPDERRRLLDLDDGLLTFHTKAKEGAKVILKKIGENKLLDCTVKEFFEIYEAQVIPQAPSEERKLQEDIIVMKHVVEYIYYFRLMQITCGSKVGQNPAVQYYATTAKLLWEGIVKEVGTVDEEA